MRSRKLATIALALLVVASPFGQLHAQTFGTAAPSSPVVTAFQAVFLGGDLGQLIIWLALIGIAWGFWHITHNIWAAIVPVVIFLLIYYRSPIIASSLMSVLSSGTIGAP